MQPGVLQLVKHIVERGHVLAQLAVDRHGNVAVRLLRQTFQRRVHLRVQLDVDVPRAEVAHQLAHVFARGVHLFQVRQLTCTPRRDGHLLANGHGETSFFVVPTKGV